MCNWILYIVLVSCDLGEIESVVCRDNRVLFRLKKEGNPVIVNNMDGWVKGYYNKWNKSDMEKQHLHDLTYMWSLK